MDQDAPHVPDDQLAADLRRWRASHPDATFTEIEQAVDTRLRTMRAALVAELAATDRRVARCARCGERLVSRGTRTRTLRTQGDEAVPVTRTYQSCPTCGTGFFPPR